MHGIGVFATEAIPADAVIERCPVLLVAPADADKVTEGSLSGYVYDWGDGWHGFALGYGSLYNHDPDPNAWYEQGEDERSLVFLARRPIPAGTEITIDYSGGGTVELWFTPGE